jgi:hypothetical protein
MVFYARIHHFQNFFNWKLFCNASIFVQWQQEVTRTSSFSAGLHFLMLQTILLVIFDFPMVFYARNSRRRRGTDLADGDSIGGDPGVAFGGQVMAKYLPATRNQ